MDTTTSVFFVATKVTSNGTAPKTKTGKGVHGQSHGQDPTQQQQQQQQQQSTSGPAQHTRSKATGMAPASATLTPGASGYETASKRWLREPNQLRLRRLRRRMTTTCTFACRGRRWRQLIRAHRDGATPCFSERWAAKCRTSASISSGTTAGTRVAAVGWRFQHHFVRACGHAAWRV